MLGHILFSHHSTSGNAALSAEIQRGAKNEGRKGRGREAETPYGDEQERTPSRSVAIAPQRVSQVAQRVFGIVGKCPQG